MVRALELAEDPRSFTHPTGWLAIVHNCSSRKKKSDNLCSEIHKSKALIPENKISHFLKTQITKIEAEGSYAFIESGVWD